MASISLSIEHGMTGTKISDFTVGTQTPAAGDFEIRFNTTDTNGKNISRHEMFLALEAFERALQQGGATIDVLLLSGGAAPPPLV
jgi:hypothetical protein